MKKNLKGILLLAAGASMALASCSDESPWRGSDTEGGINLNFSTDGRVMRQTRADDGLSPVVPSASQFAVNLVKSDGSYSKKWESVEGFNRETAFPIGDYTLTASYGDLESQGFEAPYYKGSASVHVSPGATSDVNVTATLGNAMVSVRYTDEFKSNFSGYSASVQAAGYKSVLFAQDEDRPAYIVPSDDVKLSLTLTNASNETVTIQPTTFTALERHHYVVTVGVSGNVTSGDLELKVIFDEDVVSETVPVTLGEELFSAPAPTLTPKGFTPGELISSFEYAERAQTAEFHVFAYGGLSEATLTVITDDYSPLFTHSVQLVNASPLTQDQLAAEGVDCAGFFRNVDKMAVVNVKKFLENLPAGNYTIELKAKDALTRESEPLSLEAEIKPINIALSAPQNVDFYADEVTVQLTTNCPDIKNNVTFEVPDADNRMVPATIKSITDVTGSSPAPTRADAEYKINYTLELAKQINSKIDVRAKLRKKTAEVSVPMEAPEYTITTDAFAQKVMLKLETSDPNVAQALVDGISFVDDTTSIPVTRVSRNADGIITIVGLNPSTAYVALKAKIGTFEKAIPAFTTEAATQLPNGNFDQKYNSVNITSINAGGQYQYGANKMINKSSILAEVPTGWTSINAKTCYEASSTKNTWFMVPSTMMESGAALLRSVAYDHAGNMPALDNHGLTVRAKYSRNAPNSFSSYSAGELFLGSYSYVNGTESRVNGIDFTTRPSSISFQYKYAPVNGEKGEMVVQVLAEDNTVLASGSKDLVNVSSFTDVTVNLTYATSTFQKKAAKIYVDFKSAKGDNVSAPTPTDLADVTNTTSLKGVTIDTNKYKSLCVGSKLWIDNVQLGYEASATPNSKPTKKSRR